jgi:hypothetical protein
MKTKTQINDVNQLIGMFVGDGKQNTLTEAQLQNIATSLGYRTAQVRDTCSMYDCMYDTSRLQIHVNEQNQITSVRTG